MSSKTFKCKKCKERFKLKHGRDEVERRVNACERYDCELRGRPLLFIPKLEIGSTPTSCSMKFVSKETDQYEEVPIGAFLDRNQVLRRLDAKARQPK